MAQDDWSLQRFMYQRLTALQAKEQRMSKLTQWLHNSSHVDAIEAAVRIVDDKMMDAANEYKLEVATAIVQAIDNALPRNKMFQTIEIQVLQAMISGIASYMHKRLKPYRDIDQDGDDQPAGGTPPGPPQPQPQPPQPPVTFPVGGARYVYNTNYDRPIPSDLSLVDGGFRTGDMIFVSDNRWCVSRPGELQNPGFAFLRKIG